MIEVWLQTLNRRELSITGDEIFGFKLGNEMRLATFNLTVRLEIASPLVAIEKEVLMRTLLAITILTLGLSAQAELKLLCEIREYLHLSDQAPKVQQILVKEGASAHGDLVPFQSQIWPELRGFLSIVNGVLVSSVFADGGSWYGSTGHYKINPQGDNYAYLQFLYSKGILGIACVDEPTNHQ